MSFRAARSPQRVECGSTDYDEDGHIDGMSVYCQGGQSQVAPTVADDAHYTTPTSSWTEMTRTGQAPCEQGYYCPAGASSIRLSPRPLALRRRDRKWRGPWCSTAP